MKRERERERERERKSCVIISVVRNMVIKYNTLLRTVVSMFCKRTSLCCDLLFWEMLACGGDERCVLWCVRVRQPYGLIVEMYHLMLNNPRFMLFHFRTKYELFVVRKNILFENLFENKNIFFSNQIPNIIFFSNLISEINDISEHFGLIFQTFSIVIQNSKCRI